MADVVKKQADETDVFVYGTLKRGYGNHHHLEKATFLGDAHVRGVLIQLGAFPGLLIEENGWRIKGEVWRINIHKELPTIDRLEGVPTLYQRKEVETEEFGTVQTYEYNIRPSMSREYRCIPGGVWTGAHTHTAAWAGMFGKAHVKSHLPAFGLYFDEGTGFRAVVDLQTGEIIEKNGAKKPHFAYNFTSNTWEPKKKDIIVVPAGAHLHPPLIDQTKITSNHGDLYSPPARQHDAYVPYKDSLDPGEEAVG